jgi:hypothetical protein
MGFVLPQLQFFVGCLDGGKILLDRSGWRIDIEDTLDKNMGVSNVVPSCRVS